MAVITSFRPAGFIGDGITFEELLEALNSHGCYHCQMTIAFTESAVIIDKDGERGLVHERCLKELSSVTTIDPSLDVVRKILGVVDKKEHCQAV